jgi:tetraacyldisaccharide 4'-kinase
MNLAALLYGLAVRFRLWLYRQRILPTRRLPLKVISIGNLIAGGSGKTPHTALLAGYLHKRGIKTAILSRGFRGTGMKRGAVVSDGQVIQTTVRESGEEPLWLARKLRGLPVVIGRNRYRSGMECFQKWQTEWVILDDGFQHLALARDIDLLLLPGHRPLSSERLLPSGMLREPLEAMKRAHIILISHAEQLDDSARKAWVSEIRSRSTFVPVYFSEHRPLLLWQYRDQEGLPLTWLQGKRILAFCGLADPASFRFSLRQVGADPVQLKAFPDHHHYRQKNKQEIEDLGRSLKAEVLVTTEKDAIKLGDWPASFLPVIVLAIEVEIRETGFWEMLDREVGLV